MRLRVPAHLVAAVGQTHLVRSLDTSNEAVAQERRWIALALLWEWIGTQAISDGWKPTWAAELRDLQPSLNDAGRQSADPTPALIPTPRNRKVRSQSSHPKIASRQNAVIEAMGQWLSEIEGTQTNQSRMQHALAVREFVQTESLRLDIRKVDRRLAGKFVSDVLLRSGASQNTINRKIASLSSMWQWLLKRGLATDNPWRGQGSFFANKNTDRTKRAYNSDELTKLLTSDVSLFMGQRYGSIIRDLMPIALLTGCRISELCHIKIEDILVDQRSFRITAGKTPNARRIVPVHRVIWPIVQRRATNSQDGWLFSGLTPAGPDGKRSWIVVKRFATFRQRVIGQGKQVDFHSFRRCFATYLERASTHTSVINSSVIAELMGHSKQTLALTTYSSGLVGEQLRSAIDAIDFVLEPNIIAAIELIASSETAMSKNNSLVSC